MKATLIFFTLLLATFMCVIETAAYPTIEDGDDDWACGSDFESGGDGDDDDEDEDDDDDDDDYYNDDSVEDSKNSYFWADSDNYKAKPYFQAGSHGGVNHGPECVHDDGLHGADDGPDDADDDNWNGHGDYDIWGGDVIPLSKDRLSYLKRRLQNYYRQASGPNYEKPSKSPYLMPTIKPEYFKGRVKGIYLEHSHPSYSHPINTWKNDYLQATQPTGIWKKHYIRPKGIFRPSPENHYMRPIQSTYFRGSGKRPPPPNYFWNYYMRPTQPSYLKERRHSSYMRPSELLTCLAKRRMSDSQLRQEY